SNAVRDPGRGVRRAVPGCEVCPLERWCGFREASRPGTTTTARRQAAFEGSNRQARGRIVAVLRDRPSAGIAGLVAATAIDVDRVEGAAAGLVRDGIVERRGRSLRLAR